MRAQPADERPIEEPTNWQLEALAELKQSHVGATPRKEQHERENQSSQ
jgi:hypothetical protein